MTLVEMITRALLKQTAILVSWHALIQHNAKAIPLIPQLRVSTLYPALRMLSMPVRQLCMPCTHGSIAKGNGAQTCASWLRQTSPGSTMVVSTF